MKERIFVLVFSVGLELTEEENSDYGIYEYYWLLMLDCHNEKEDEQKNLKIGFLVFKEEPAEVGEGVNAQKYDFENIELNVDDKINGGE